LYGLYPANQISPYRNPELFSAANQTLISRGDISTGWSMGWKVNFWARMKDGNHAYTLIKNQLTLVFQKYKVVKVVELIQIYLTPILPSKLMEILVVLLA
jgi:hypothetical protein